MPFSVAFTTVLLFLSMVILSGYFFVRALGDFQLQRYFISWSMVWILLQSVVAYSGFYTITEGFPPRMIWLILPPALLMIWVFWKRTAWLTTLSLQWLTYLSVVRIGVEIVLHQLYKAGGVPQIMTFEGRNFDILIGISSWIVAYYVFSRQTLSRRVLLAWHITGLVFLLNIVVIAILSVPTPLQQFGFEQANIAVLYVPFCLLPAYIVPLVLYSHVIAIWRLYAGH